MRDTFELVGGARTCTHSRPLIRATMRHHPSQRQQSTDAMAEALEASIVAKLDAKYELLLEQQLKRRIAELQNALQVVTRNIA